MCISFCISFLESPVDANMSDEENLKAPLKGRSRKRTLSSKAISEKTSSDETKKTEETKPKGL